MPNPPPPEALVGRTPPAALDVEAAVLGTILIDKEAIHTARTFLRDATIFLDSRNQRIFAAACGLAERDAGIDLVTLSAEMKRLGTYDEAGGYYLSELTTHVANVANVEHHCRILVEKAILREVIRAGMVAANSAYDPTADAFEVVDTLEQTIYDISNRHITGQLEPTTAVTARVLKQMKGWAEAKREVTGLDTGLDELNYLTAGWQNDELIYVAGRTSMGKTAYALQNAYDHASGRFGDPIPVVFFSLEMSAGQLVQRLACTQAGVNLMRIRKGDYRDGEWKRIEEAMLAIDKSLLIVDDQSRTMAQIRSRGRVLKAEKNIRMVVVDYLQLMVSERLSTYRGNREQEIAHNSRQLKDMAKALNLPMLVLAQLSRAVEARGGDKRPQLSDLRESGSIEQDADVVAFIYRAERYGIEMDGSGGSTEGKAEIIIGKQRSGPLGTANVAFDGPTTSFHDTLPTIQTTNPVTVEQHGNRVPTYADPDDLPF